MGACLNGHLVILITHSYFLHHDAKQLARMMPYSPLSTLIAAARLRQEAHEVEFFDATFANDVTAFTETLDRAHPSLVAVMEDNFNYITKMCTARRRRDALAMIKAAKQRGCRVVVNGPDSNDKPSPYLDAGADVVLTGDGEEALAEIAAAWRRDPTASLSNIAGLILDDGNSTKPRLPQRNLDKLPLPAWDLIDANAYRSAWLGKHDHFSWNIATSRGCPYACNWCAKPSFGRGYEQRSPQAVAMELRLLKDRVAPNHIWFSDDIFGLTSGWLREFAGEVTRLDAQIPFMMQSRVNLMRLEAVVSLAQAGAQEVWLGVESGSQKILDAMEKGSSLEEARDATRNLKAHGIRACWFIQLGYPGETWEDILSTRDLIRSEKPDDIGVSVAYPLPGTRFYELVRAELGERHNWEESDDLAMLFQGTFDTAFYRAVRDALHDEVSTGQPDDCRWARLAHDAVRHRSANPVLLATGS
jgi:anaerobic magnesium-protoporphyrin IX monomethyl ester cyclase